MSTFTQISHQLWASSPDWVKFEMRDLAKAGQDNEGLLILARYELYAFTVNAYSSVTNGNVLPGVDYQGALFRSLPQTRFNPPHFHPFPLLPLSQDYSPQAVQQALTALNVLTNLRAKHVTDKKEATRLWKFTGEAEAAKFGWAHMWAQYSVERRRMVSRSLWNTFVLVLQGDKVPTANDVFFTRTVHSPAIGGAQAFDLPEGASALGAVAAHIRASDAAFRQTLVLISTHFNEHFPHLRTWLWPPEHNLGHDYSAVCFLHLAQRGGMAGLQQEERRRLLVELFMIYHKLTRLRLDHVARPGQIFECIAATVSLSSS
ncbi:hypothetical protein JCM11251_004650 [Rhodosporidiobolus azoricus]